MQDDEIKGAGEIYPTTEPTVGGRRHRRVWIAVAALLAFAGVGGSVYGFGSVRGASERSHKALASSSVEVAAALRLAIQHEQDLIVSTESFIIGNPNPSQSQFTEWANEVGALKRYPELLGLVVVQYVPAQQLGDGRRACHLGVLKGTIEGILHRSVPFEDGKHFLVGGSFEAEILKHPVDRRMVVRGPMLHGMNNRQGSLAFAQIAGYRFAENFF